MYLTVLLPTTSQTLYAKHALIHPLIKFVNILFDYFSRNIELIILLWTKNNKLITN